MYHAMISFTEHGTMYQRALRLRGFDSIEKAREFAKKKAKGAKPFVVDGQRVVWAAGLSPSF